MKLDALQIEFQSHLLGQPSSIGSAIRGGGIGIEARLAIYHHAYRARLVEALRDSFGHTLLYLGDEGFDVLALEFIEANPSTDPNLRWYGAPLPDWLARRLPHDPDVAELARLDAALRGAFDSANAPVLELAALAAVPPEAWATLGFAFQPSVARLRLHHNTLALWQALDSEQTPPTTQPLDAPTELLIWRLETQPHFRSLGALESAALDALLAGASFATTCADLDERFADVDVAQQSGALLRRWVDDGLLSAVRS
jgi:hypothetical protein